MAGYGSDAEFQAYAEARDKYDPALAQGTLAGARQRGSDYLDAMYEDRFPGNPTGGADQERAWPRTGATDRYGNAIGPGVVPQRIVNASYEAALIEIVSPGALSAVVSGTSLVKRERVEGAVEVEYAVSENTVLATAIRPVASAIEGMLTPLLVAWVPGVLVV